MPSVWTTAHVALSLGVLGESRQLLVHAAAGGLAEMAVVEQGVVTV